MIDAIEQFFLVVLESKNGEKELVKLWTESILNALKSQWISRSQAKRQKINMSTCNYLKVFRAFKGMKGHQIHVGIQNTASPMCF